ncbi:MAG: stage 0 sporulation protein [Clostridia bacterium]|nr:stage 0 sporulation protein [Clostridia bacterium]
MATVIGVRFKKAGKVYYFDPNEFWPKPGDNVVVETARGLEFGEVVTSARSVADEQIVAPLKKVVRMATEEDIQRAETNAQREAEAFRVCQEKVTKHKLEMKLVSVEYTFDNSKIIFYFTANGRVDFRELVKDLASVFKMRIELRQIGVRDEAKMLGGLGSCGRPICCGAFLGDFQPVSIKMAKEQNLSLNPTKISGLCGRLMCCLKYEQDNYEAVLKRVPRVGKDIVTPDGVGVITEINAIKEQVRVRIRTAEDTFDIREYAIDDVRRPGPGDSAAVREQPKTQEKRPRKGAEPEQPEDENAEENKKKRYPHQKAPKNMSTDQFLEKMKETDETDSAPAEKPEKESHEPAEGKEPKEKEGGQHKKRRRGGKGRHREEGAQGEAAAPSEKGEQPAKNPPAKVEKPAAEAE